MLQHSSYVALNNLAVIQIGVGGAILACAAAACIGGLIGYYCGYKMSKEEEEKQGGKGGIPTDRPVLK